MTPQSLTEEQKAAQRLSPDVLGDQKDKGKATDYADSKESEASEVVSPTEDSRVAAWWQCEDCGGDDTQPHDCKPYVPTPAADGEFLRFEAEGKEVWEWKFVDERQLFCQCFTQGEAVKVAATLNHYTYRIATRATGSSLATGTPGAVSDDKKDALPTPKVEDSVAKPVDTGGVEGGGETEQEQLQRISLALFDAQDAFEKESPSKSWTALDTVRFVLANATEKPTDSMGGEMDKENGRSDDLRSVTDEGSQDDLPGADAFCEKTGSEINDSVKIAGGPHVWYYQSSGRIGFDGVEIRNPVIDAGDMNGRTSGAVVDLNRRIEEIAQDARAHGEARIASEVRSLAMGMLMQADGDEDESFEKAYKGLYESVDETFYKLTIGGKQNAPANHSVTPRGGSADSINPTPVIVGIPTTPGKFIDPSPQPEKREGPSVWSVEYETGEWPQLICNYPNGVEKVVHVENAILRLNELEALVAQPEGDERNGEQQ